MTQHSISRKFAVTGAVLAVALTLAACSSSSNKTSATGPSAGGTQSAATTAAPGSASGAASSGQASAASAGAPQGTAPASPPTGPVPKLTIGTPGVPPVISALLPYIASKKGFYKEFGVDVTVKNFQTGTDATRAASTGQIDMAIMPPAQQIALVAKGTDLVGVQGQEKPDWTVVSSDPSITSCSSLKGQSLGVDAVGGIRYTALVQMLKSCGLTIKDVHPLVFPGDSNPQAVIAGQLKTSVLHLNEVVKVDQQTGKKLTVVMTMADAVPNTMYEVYGTLKSKLDSNREAYVRFVAAQIATLNWMFNPANADEVAQLATVVGDTAAVMKDAMAQYKQMGFWNLSDAGLPQSNIENVVKNQVAAGKVTADKAPTYAQLVDTSIYQDAQKLVAQH